MVSFTGFYDITGSFASRVPLVSGNVVAYYATGSGGIEETAAQVAAAKAAGMGVILIDQTPSLSVFAAGLADVADVEAFAGTNGAAAATAARRNARGSWSWLYTSLSNLSALRSACVGIPRVGYWVADYSWSQAQAEAFIAANPDVVAVQYGDPNSNPNTLIPGTRTTLAEANADIDIALTSWLNGFLPAPPAPVIPAYSTPTGLSATPWGSLNLGWNADPHATPGVTSYHYQVAHESTGALAADASTTNTFAHVGGLRPGLYQYRVQALADATPHGVSPWSPWTTAYAV